MDSGGNGDSAKVITFNVGDSVVASETFVDDDKVGLNEVDHVQAFVENLGEERF